MNTFRIPRFTAEASLSARSRGVVYAAMMDDDGIDCTNCVGGDCAALHCFENWTHSGGGPGGPYGGGGGGGGGGVGGRSCRDNSGRLRGPGTRITTTVVRPPGGPENTYVIRQRCRNGSWVDEGF